MRRVESVDVFRLIAIIAVIAIHTQPFRGHAGEPESWKLLSILIDQLARFAVPFFFVISGFFWGVKVNSGADISAVSSAMAKRIFSLFVIWSIIYLLPYNLTTIPGLGLLGPIKYNYWVIASAAEKSPLNLLMTGTKAHLWFLFELLCALGINSVFIKQKFHKALIAVSLALYLFGLAAKAYANTPVGVDTAIDTINGPFFGTIFFATGYFLSRLSPNPGWLLKGFGLWVIGCLVHFSEIYFLRASYDASPYQDYVIGTYFMGLGAAMIALSNIAFFRIRALEDLGKFTLGIYAIHFIFVDLLRPLGKLTNSAFWEIGYVFLVLLLSIGSVMLLSKFRITRQAVM